MSDAWWTNIKMTFPVLRYHPPIKHGDGVVICKTHTLLNSPLSAWGSADHSKSYMNHGGEGLSRSAEYPYKDFVLPGGILDAEGQHIPILDVDARQHKPHPVVGFFLGFFILFYTYQYRYSFGEPEQLELDDFKDRIIKLGKQERKMPRPTKKILAAKSFYEVMQAECEAPIADAYHATVDVKNWIDKAKRYG